MATYEFISDYETGIELIDNEHRKFFDYINEAVEALDMPGEDGLSVAKQLLKKLTDYANEHFAHEEDYMHNTHDAQLLLQMRDHQNFKDHVEVVTKKDNLTKKDLGDLFVFMAKWLKNHILISDKMIGKVQTEGHFTMTEEFMVGVETIDSEHERLFEMIGKAFDIMEDEFIFDKYDPIVDLLGELKDYTAVHFADEEAYMEKIGYNGLAAQKLVHEAFIDKIAHIDLDDLASMDENQQDFINDLLKFLTDWLIQHILKMDKKIPSEV